MDKYQIDSHKLMYHIPRVNDWLSGKNIYPIYMEISPSAACNHRCSYCGHDFLEYKPVFLDVDIMKIRLKEMGCLGVKSVMFCGDGEPLMNKRFDELVLAAYDSGIDAAITTNGVLLNKSLARKILGITKWIKVSINAGTRDTYSLVHGTKAEDFDTVIYNIKQAVAVKKENGNSCAIGMQIILLPENAEEVKTLAGIAKNIGVDYLVIKPYSQHPKSITKKYGGISYDAYQYLEDEMKAFNTETFNVIYRSNAINKWDSACRSYNKCNALPFWAYIDTKGNVWGCSVYLQDKNFEYGNIYENTFKEIWEGETRMSLMKWAEKNLDATQCRINCRMDTINQYLWSIKNPSPHVNFI